MPPRRPERTTLLIAGVALLACLVLGAWWLDVQNDQMHGASRYEHYRYSLQPATIQDWMTFNYLNSVFALPPDYFENSLGITDPTYPDLSIRQYAARHDLDAATLLGHVRTAVAAAAHP